MGLACPGDEALDPAIARLEGAGYPVTAGTAADAAERRVTRLARTVRVVRFYHCNERHHTLALAGVPFDPPQRLHHLMFETNDRDDVGAAFDRAFASDLTITNGLGRHENDGMFSFYVAGPAGFQVEVGHGARTITDPWDDDRPYDRISLWGHQPVARP